MTTEKQDIVPEKTTRGLFGSQGTFVAAFSKQNQHVETAIKSLDNLNDQIVQFIYTPPARHKSPGDLDLSHRDHERLRASMSLMRHLLVDAQTKFRKMVEDNKRLASRIDGSIQAANQEVKAIRDELVDTNRRLTQLGVTTSDLEGERSAERDEPDVVTDSTRKKPIDNQEREELSNLREENARLQKIIEDLNSELCHLRDAQNTSKESRDNDDDDEDIVRETAVTMTTSPPVTDPGQYRAAYNEQFRDIQQQMVQAHQELARAKEALLAMKSDRKRLQSEKLDLLSQLRQLYCTLEDKDAEIRDFIRKFEQQMRESNDSIKQLAAEKEECEHEKWEILCKAQETSERCVTLRAEVLDKDGVISLLEGQLNEAKERIRNYENQAKTCNVSVDSSDLTAPSSRSSCRLKSSSVSVDSMLKSTSMDSHSSPSSEELPPYTEVVTNGNHSDGRHGNDKSIRSDSSHSSFGGPNLTQSLDNIRPMAESSRSSDDMTSNIYVSIPGELNPAELKPREYNPRDIKTFIDLKAIQKKRRSNTSTFSRIFGSKARSRKSIAVSDPSILEGGKASRDPSPKFPLRSASSRDLSPSSGLSSKESTLSRRSAGQSSRSSSREGSPRRLPRRSQSCRETSTRLAPKGQATVHFVGIDAPEELSPRLSMLSEDNFPAKMDALRQAHDLGVTQWRAGHVLAWLEMEMNMPAYGRTCGENVKSGKVLLGLSDSELDSALGLDSPLHRRKLRLAIEELRDPSTVRFAAASRLDHTWLAHRWLADLGLPQYALSFEAQLVDGRLLNVLTKKDLERHLGVQRRFHQNSVLYGIELLRRLKYSKEELMDRRRQCELSNTDPLVWTNHRLLQWLQSIDLHEYVPALHESGLHGAVLVLETAFTADAFASALNIPATKAYVRRHLASELDALVRPARAALDGVAKRSRSSSASLNRSFVRSYRGGQVSDDARAGGAKRLSFRGSLGRALGRKSRSDSASRKEDEVILTSDTNSQAAGLLAMPTTPSQKRGHSKEAQGTSV